MPSMVMVGFGKQAVAVDSWTAYDTAVGVDSPWNYWKFQEASGTAQAIVP